MANYNRINNVFKQQNGICALASYGTVIEYYSNGEITINMVLERYAELNKLFDIKSCNLSEYEKQAIIGKHFNDSCIASNTRGFDAIFHLHEEDLLITKNCCKIIGIKTNNAPLPSEYNTLVKNALESNDSLAMILYKVNEINTEKGMQVNHHAIVTGCCDTSRKYFTKDPENPNIQLDDSFFGNGINEYLVFAPK